MLKIHFFIFVIVLETPKINMRFSKHVCILIALIRIITYSRYIEPLVQWDEVTEAHIDDGNIFDVFDDFEDEEAMKGVEVCDDVIDENADFVEDG